jgi:glycosyltransferase involved in cell wall biosynthesis
MKMNSHPVSVVIPTFNRRQSLDKIISPLLDDPATGEIVVVIDGASDGTFEFLTDWSSSEPRIRPIYQKNAGEALARRRGIHEARFDLVLLIDDDVEADPDLVTGHARLHSGSDHLVVLGYMPVIGSSGRKGGQAATILYAKEYENICKLYEKDRSEIFRHMWGGNMSIRRADALRLGDEPEVRLDYHADLRFGLQCEKAGLTAVFDRSLASRHWHERSLRKFAEDAGRSGMARAEIIREYPDLAPTLDPLLDISSRGKLAARCLSLPWVRPIASPITMSLCRWSGRFRAWRLEIALTRAIRKIETIYAFRKSSKIVARRSVDSQSEFD